MSGTRDLAELLNVNVDELARARALVANRLLEPDPAKPAHADPRQDPRHRRKRHPERLSDLSRCEAQPAQLHDRLDPVLFGAIGDPPRGRGTVRQPRLPPAPVTPNPLPRATDADARSRSRRGHGRTLLDDQHTQPPPTAPTERRVTVKLHPVSSLDWGALTAPSFQGDPDEPTCSGTTPRRLLLGAVRARALIATATCACLADHARHSIAGQLSVAGDDLNRRMAVARLPRLHACGQNGAVVAVADTVQYMHLDLVRPVFDAKAR